MQLNWIERKMYSELGRRQVKKCRVDTQGERGVFNGNLGAELPGGFSGRPPVSGLATKPPETENLSAFGCPTEAANSPHSFFHILQTVSPPQRKNSLDLHQSQEQSLEKVGCPPLSIPCRRPWLGGVKITTSDYNRICYGSALKHDINIMQSSYTVCSCLLCRGNTKTFNVLQQSAARSYSSLYNFFYIIYKWVT